MYFLIFKFRSALEGMEAPFSNFMIFKTFLSRLLSVSDFLVYEKISRSPPFFYYLFEGDILPAMLFFLQISTFLILVNYVLCFFCFFYRNHDFNRNRCRNQKIHRRIMLIMDETLNII